jgi:hypothetical protein
VCRGGGFAVEAERLAGDVGDASELGVGLAEQLADLIHLVGVARDVDEVGEAFEGIVDFVGDGGGHASGGGEFFRTHEGSFGEAALGDVAEDEDDADHVAFAVADGSAAVVDADLLAVFGDEEGVVGEADDGAETADLIHRIFNDGSGLLVEDAEDIVEGETSGFAFGPAGELLGYEVHEGDVAVGVAGDDGIADAAEGDVEPLLARIGLFGAELDLPDLRVIEAGELVEEFSGLPGDEGGDGESEGDEREDADAVCSIGGDDAAGAEGLFGSEEIVRLAPEAVHALLAGEHVRFYFGGSGRGRDLAMGFLLPLLMRGLEALQARELVGLVRNESGECGELGLELLVGFVEGLQEELVPGEEVSTKAGLFIDYELDEAIGMADDEVGVIDRPRAVLDVLQADAKKQSEDSKRCNRQGKKTDQESGILPRIHSDFLYSKCNVWLFDSMLILCRPAKICDSTFLFYPYF